MAVETTQTPFLRAARVLESKKPYGPALQKWWENFSKAEDVYRRYGTLEGNLTANDLTNWVTASRRNWKNGNLLNDQIKALQSIGVYRNSYFSSRPKKHCEPDSLPG